MAAAWSMTARRFFPDCLLVPAIPLARRWLSAVIVDMRSSTSRTRRRGHRRREFGRESSHLGRRRPFPPRQRNRKPHDNLDDVVGSRKLCDSRRCTRDPRQRSPPAWQSARRDHTWPLRRGRHRRRRRDGGLLAVLRPPARPRPGRRRSRRRCHQRSSRRPGRRRPCRRHGRRRARRSTPISVVGGQAAIDRLLIERHHDGRLVVGGPDDDDDGWPALQSAAHVERRASARRRHPHPRRGASRERRRRPRSAPAAMSAAAPTSSAALILSSSFSVALTRSSSL